jgi:U-box domain
VAVKNDAFVKFSLGLVLHIFLAQKNCSLTECYWQNLCAVILCQQGIAVLIGIFPVSVSNEVPEHPVVSPVSGCIYERRLIEKYITENGTDPMNGEKLTVDELVNVKSK